MAVPFRQTEHVSFDFAQANKFFAENKYPEHDPVVGDRSRTGIVCCSDPRCMPEKFFKLDFQEAFTIRNEGGRTADPSVMRVILLIDSVGFTVNERIEEIMVVHHTDCSALLYNDKMLLDIVVKNDPDVPGGPWKQGAEEYAETVASMPFPKGATARERLEKSVIEDVLYLRLHPLMKPKTRVSGWIYDLETGAVENIPVAIPSPNKV